MSQPRRTDYRARVQARRTRDEQWRFAEKVARLGVVWVCWWDKYHRHREERGRDGTWHCWIDRERSGPPDENFESYGLICGVELLRWLKSHRDWWKIGRWSEKRCASPVRITDAGRAALLEREKYDMEPLDCGMVEPGWTVVPARRRQPPEANHD